VRNVSLLEMVVVQLLPLVLLDLEVGTSKTPSLWMHTSSNSEILIIQLQIISASFVSWSLAKSHLKTIFLTFFPPLTWAFPFTSLREQDLVVGSCCSSGQKAESELDRLSHSCTLPCRWMQQVLQQSHSTFLLNLMDLVCKTFDFFSC